MTLSLVETLKKYKLYDYLIYYVNNGIFPLPKIWKNIVKRTIYDYEQSQWISQVSNRTELSRFSKIHPCLTGHLLWRLSYLYTNYQHCLGLLCRLGLFPIVQHSCEKCNRDVSDIIKHYILSCESYVQERNVLLERIVDILPVQKSVEILEQDEDDLLVTLLGGMTNSLEQIDDSMLAYVIVEIARCIYTWNIPIPKLYIDTHSVR